MSSPTIGRVLALTSTFPARPGDGSPEFTQTFSAALPVDEVAVVAPMMPGARADETIGRLRVHRFRYALRGGEALANDAILPALKARPALVRQVPGFLAGFLAATVSALRRRPPDLVHAHWIVPGGLVAALATRRTGCPFVVSAHGADAYGLQGRLATVLKRWVLGRATVVFPVSAEIGERLRALDAGRIGPVVPMGIDVDELRRAAGEPAPEAGRVLFVGRLADKKGVDVLLEAMTAVPGGWELHVVGDGPERPNLEETAARSGVGGQVRFHGRLDRRAVLEQFRRAAVVVLPSVEGAGGDRDGTPLVLMEAMALGVPVIVSDLGGLAETVNTGHNGLVVAPGDPVALAQAVERTLTDPRAARQRADRAEADARELFDLSVVTSRLIEVTEQQLGSP